MTSDSRDPAPGSDAFRVLGWGLRRYGWLVVVCMAALGVMVPAQLAQLPEQYDAQAQVGPTEPLNLPNLDPLPRLGETVFDNGAVAAAVRDAFVPPLPASEPVIPDRVELVAAQDNIVFTIIGHGPTPAAARQSANTAAEALTSELNKYTGPVGAFAIQRLADTPQDPVPTVVGRLAVGLGLLAGLLAGLGLIVAILAWRRPVVDLRETELSARSGLLAKVRLARRHDGVLGMPQLCHQLRSRPLSVVFLIGASTTSRARRRLAEELSDILGRTRPVTVLRGDDWASLVGPGQEPAEDDATLLVVDGPTHRDVAVRPPRSMALLVVPEGVPHAHLRKQVDSYLDDGPSGIVMVKGSAGGPWTWWSRRHPRRDQLPPTMSTADDSPYYERLKSPTPD